MRLRALSAALAVAGVAGCSGPYAVGPLPADHPANPAAAAAPAPPDSETLAYDQPVERPAPMDSMQHMDHGSGGMEHMGDSDHGNSDAAESGSGEKGGRR